MRALPLDGVVFRDLLDAGSVELALAHRTDEENPVVGAVIAVIEAAALTPATLLGDRG